MYPKKSTYGRCPFTMRCAASRMMPSSLVSTMSRRPCHRHISASTPAKMSSGVIAVSDGIHARVLAPAGDSPATAGAAIAAVLNDACSAAKGVRFTWDNSLPHLQEGWRVAFGNETGVRPRVMHHKCHHEGHDGCLRADNRQRRPNPQ